jgi:hypothetical protein
MTENINKFGKEKKVIELHLQGKTIPDIAIEVHIVIWRYFKKIKNMKEK